MASTIKIQLSNLVAYISFWAVCTEKSAISDEWSKFYFGLNAKILKIIYTYIQKKLWGRFLTGKLKRGQL